MFGGEIADAATTVGDTALGVDATTAADATVRNRARHLRDPPVGDIGSLSPEAQKAYDAALASGKSPSAAFQEASSLDNAAKASGLGPKQVRVDPSAATPPTRVSPMPDGLSPSAESVYKSAVEGGMPPDEAAKLARDLERRRWRHRRRRTPRARRDSAAPSGRRTETGPEDRAKGYSSRTPGQGDAVAVIGGRSA